MPESPADEDYRCDTCGKLMPSAGFRCWDCRKEHGDGPKWQKGVRYQDWKKDTLRKSQWRCQLCDRPILSKPLAFMLCADCRERYGTGGPDSPLWLRHIASDKLSNTGRYPFRGKWAELKEYKRETEDRTPLPWDTPKERRRVREDSVGLMQEIGDSAWDRWQASPAELQSDFYARILQGDPQDDIREDVNAALEVVLPYLTPQRADAMLAYLEYGNQEEAAASLRITLDAFKKRWQRGLDTLRRLPQTVLAKAINRQEQLVRSVESGDDVDGWVPDPMFWSPPLWRLLTIDDRYLIRVYWWPRWQGYPGEHLIHVGKRPLIGATYREGIGSFCIGVNKKDFPANTGPGMTRGPFEQWQRRKDHVTRIERGYKRLKDLGLKIGTRPISSKYLSIQYRAIPKEPRPKDIIIDDEMTMDKAMWLERWGYLRLNGSVIDSWRYLQRLKKKGCKYVAEVYGPTLIIYELVKDLHSRQNRAFPGSVWIRWYKGKEQYERDSQSPTDE